MRWWSLVLILFGCGAPPARIPESRELKLVLDGARFNDAQRGLDMYWTIVRTTAAEQGVVLRGAADPFKTSRRSVAYLDTADFALRRAGFVLRRRIKYKKGALKKKAEYALKYRSKVWAEAGRQVLDERGRHDLKFEEDVVWREGPTRIYSLRVKMKTKRRPPMTIGGFAETFPALLGLNIAPETPLSVVRDRVLEETKASPGRLDFGQGLTAQVDLSIWHDAAHPERPMLAEISFGYPIRDFHNQLQPANTKVFTFYKALRARSALWLATGGTKTQRVYEDN